jgi:hypothetical protein
MPCYQQQAILLQINSALPHSAAVGRKAITVMCAGERDGECPAPQSFEFWHALKTLGVETQLVVYADEGHRISQPAHKRDIARRLVSWFDVHLK